MMSTTSTAGSDTGEESLKRLEALHLILPRELLPPIKISETETPRGEPSTKPKEGTTTLRGYQTLQELREKVSTFRQGMR